MFRVLAVDEWSSDIKWLYNRAMFLYAMGCCNYRVYVNEAYACDALQGAWTAYVTSYAYEHYLMSKLHHGVDEKAWDAYSHKNADSIARGEGVSRTIPYTKLGRTAT